MSYTTPTQCLHTDGCKSTAVALPHSVFQLCERHLDREFPGPDVAKYRKLLDQYGHGR